MTRPANEEEKKRAAEALGDHDDGCSDCHSRIAAALATYGDERERMARSELLAVAADMHRAKWRFDLGDAEDPSIPRPSKAELTTHVERAFDLLHGFGNRVLAIADRAPQPEIRALAAQSPAPKPQCDGCARLLPFAMDATLIHGRPPHVEEQDDGGNVYTPCTADRTKEPGR